MTPRNWANCALATSVATLVAAFALPPGPVRALVTIGFLLLVPGLAIVRLLDLPGSLTRFVLAVALSVAVETAGTLVMVYTHTWSPDTFLVLLCAGCCLAALVEVRRSGAREVAPQH
jgi:uncharacterized membrane protein